MTLQLSTTCVRLSNGEDDVLWHSVYRDSLIGESIDGLVFAPRFDWRYYELRKAGMRGRPSAGNTECYADES